jgi:hypothetical protein
MAAVSLPVPNRVALVINWLRRAWRDWFYRVLLDACQWRDGRQIDSVADEVSAAKLFAAGQSAAAVWACRIRLERRLEALCNSQGNSAMLGNRAPMTAMVPFLLNNGALSKRLARRINTVYRTCSCVVHYGKVHRDNARQIVTDVEDILATLDFGIVEAHICAMPANGGAA